MKAVLMMLGFLVFSCPAWAEEFQLTSTAFNNNADIPAKYTCDGSDINPVLIFKNVPANAKTLALTVTDPDAPEGTWTHWIIYNMSPNMGQINENTNPGTEGLSDFGKYAWSGPCPSDEKLHHYIFHAYALNAILNINEGPNLTEVEKAFRGHVTAEARLTGTYQKSPF